MQRRERIVLLAALLLIGAGCYWGTVWFLENHQRHTREVRTDLSPQARRNPLLAAQRFVGLFGAQARSISGRERLLHPPAEKGLFIVHRLGPSLPRASEDAWIAWMRQGGRMMLTAEVEADDENNQANNLLVRFDVHLNRIDDGGHDAAALKEDRVQTLHYPGHEEPVKIALNPRLVLDDQGKRADHEMQGPYGPHLLNLAVGEGALIILSENGFLTNDLIGRNDHAWLLATLVEQADKVWFLYSSEMPGLPLLIWRNAPWLVIALLLLLMLALWRFSFRTGPLLPQTDQARRDLLEHLQAGAAWAWRVEKGMTMLDANSRMLAQGWLQRHPGLRAMTPDARCEWIAAQSGITQETVNLAINGRAEDDRGLIMLSAAQRALLLELRQARHT